MSVHTSLMATPGMRLIVKETGSGSRFYDHDLRERIKGFKRYPMKLALSAEPQ